MKITGVSDASFGRDVLGATMPVLVEFCAGQSRTPALDELVEQLQDRVKLVRLDVGFNHTLKGEYEIRALPTLMLFKNGKLLARRVGGRLAKAEVEEWVSSALILALATRRTTAARCATGFKLSNGMEVVVIPDHRMPIVTHMVWYKVGTADDPKGASGISALVRDLTSVSMSKDEFGGKMISRLGGRASSIIGADSTYYCERIGKDHLKTVMEVEAHRMAELRVTDADVETVRHTVIEARHSQFENNPRVRLVEQMAASLFRGHPYGKMVLPRPSEIARLTLDDAVSFYKRHYAPNNAVLVVSGDVTPEEVKRLAEEIYGKLPANPDVRGRQRPQVPMQIAARRVSREDANFKSTTFRRDFAVPCYMTAKPGEAEALQLLAKIVGGGTASRLYSKLVIEGLAATAECTYSGFGFNSGDFALTATAGDLGVIEAGVDAVLDDIRKYGVTQHELACAKTALIADFIFVSNDQEALATFYGRSAATGRSIAEVEDWPASISRTRAADLKKVVSTYLIPRRSVTGWLAPAPESSKYDAALQHSIP